MAQSVKFIRRGGIYPARGTPRRREPGGYGIRPYGAPRGLYFPGWPPCFPGSVGRAFTPAAPLKFKTGNIPTAANTPCRGRFHIGPPCRAAYLPYKPGQTSRPPGLPETQNLPVGAGFIPPAEPRADANRADMESAPTVHRGGCIFPGGREPRPIPHSSFLIPNFSPLSRPPDTIRTHPRGRMGASETKRRKRGASR